MTERPIKRILNIKGMTCSSCEMKIENALKKKDGIIEVKAAYNSSKVYLTYDADKIDLDKISEAIEKLHYTVLNRENSDKQDNRAKEKFAQEKLKINQLLGIGIILFAIYFIIKNTIGFNFIPEVNQSMGYGILFIIGFLTSLHCIAMCGGINLSQCVSYNLESESSKFRKVTPSLLYNLGRVISYTIVGGIVGALGSIVSFSGGAKGIVAIIAGGFMVIMGLNMLNVFPWLRKINPRMPRLFGEKIHQNKNKKGPLYVGLLNGLMPCGPLQSMQLYALGTGSLIAGATSMFLFSLGTVPLMFGFGVVSSLLSSKFTHKIMKASAVLVMVLGIIMINRGLSLAGMNIAFASSGKGNVAKIEGDVQVATTKVTSGSYEPFIVQKGIPVKWIIQVKENDLNGCNNSITIPKYNIQKKLVAGDNIIEFVPEEEGNITYTCWMGMITSNIKVVSDISNVSKEDIDKINNSNIGTSSIVGGCCLAVTSEAFADGNIPTDDIAVGKITDGVQSVSINVNDYGFSPAVVVIQKGIETRWVLNGQKLNSCNYRLQFPAYNSNMELKEGENEIKFVPEGDFYFSCWMGMINGYVKVVDDINNINIDEIKKEVQDFELPAGSGGCCG